LIKNNIILGTDGDNVGFDKMQIALAIRNSTFEGGLQCLLLEDKVLNSCVGCNLRPICEGLESLADDYLASTTKVVNSFSFQ
jgi:hypothetical protein